MDTLWGLIVLVATLLSREVVTGLGGAEPGFNVGCRFAEGLCDENAEEDCYDDNVFGRCLPSNLQLEGSHKFLHKFKLSPEDVAGLQWTLKHLDSLGYTWTDFYTQCILQVLLEGFRSSQILDLSVCKEFEEAEVDFELLKQLTDQAGTPKLPVTKSDGNVAARHDSPIVYADEIYYPPNNDLDQLEIEQEIKNLPYGRENGGNSGRFTKTPGREVELSELYSEGEAPSRRQKHKIDSQSEAEIFQNYMLRPDEIQPSKAKRSRFEPTYRDDEESQIYQLSPEDIRVLEELAVAENKEISDEQVDGDVTEEEPETEEEILEIPTDAILRNPTFLRQERLDVKKPGPHYRVNNFAFDDLEERLNEEDRRIFNSRRDRTLFSNHRIHPKTHRRVLPVLQEENDAWISEDDYEFEPNRGLYWPRWNYNEMNPDAGLDEAVRIEEILEKMAHERKDLPNVIHQGMAENHSEHLEEPRKDQVSTIPPIDSLTPSTADEKKKPGSAGFARLAALQGLNVHEARRSEMSRLGVTTVESLTTADDDLERYNVVDTDYVFLVVKERFKTWKQGAMVVKLLADLLQVPHATFSDVRVDDSLVTFRVLPNRSGLNASYVATSADQFKDKIMEKNGVSITATGIGDTAQVTSLSYASTDKQLLAWSIGLCATVAAALTAAGILYLIRKGSAARRKLAAMGKADAEASQDYKDLCRARMSKPGTKVSSHPAFHGKDSEATPLIKQHRDSESNRSSRSSTSSWCEEPITSNIDISTGHMVLAYMEDHLRNRDRLEQEWETLCGYEADPNSTTVASKAENAPKNRVPDILPYDHNRVVLSELANASGSDYINASTITDHDPRNPAYIATQGPLPMTVTDFWQLVWEQGSVLLVLLTRLSEHGEQLCYRYWPEEGSQTFHIYEVHLVSEHIWCDDYLVRSFYLKNLRTGETRTVTQFHFLSWTEGGIPISAKSLLEFRRKVNKSYRGRSCPIIVHCSDGAGRTGTYCLIDMVLNRISKGAKEIDIAATLEHLRDQRIGMVRTRQQFEFVLKAVAEEVHAILRALPQ